MGGPARYFAEAKSEAEVIEAVEFARPRELPLFVLGGGSNLVVSDRGFAGLVLKIAIAGGRTSLLPRATRSSSPERDATGRVRRAQTVEANCAGLECLSGIPGTVGGTPVQNVGAYGQEVAETITEVRALDLRTLEVVALANAECGFAYRSSKFKDRPSVGGMSSCGLRLR